MRSFIPVIHTHSFPTPPGYLPIALSPQGKVPELRATHSVSFDSTQKYPSSASVAVVVVSYFSSGAVTFSTAAESGGEGVALEWRSQKIDKEKINLQYIRLFDARRLGQVKKTLSNLRSSF